MTLPKNKKPDLEAIRKRLGAADGEFTSGDWFAANYANDMLPMVWDACGDAIVSKMPNGDAYFEPEIAEFIANAKQDIPALLKYISYLEDERVTSATKILKLSQALEMATNRIDLQVKEG